MVNAVVLRDLSGREGPRVDLVLVFLFVPTGGQLDHRLASSIAERSEQVIELFIEEHVLARLFVHQEDILHQEFSLGLVAL